MCPAIYNDPPISGHEISVLKRRLATVSLVCVAGLVLAAAAWWVTQRDAGRAATQQLLARYCVDCHNPVDLTADLVIDPKSLDSVGVHAEHWEKVVRKLRAESMPPDDPRPAAERVCRRRGAIWKRSSTRPPPRTRKPATCRCSGASRARSTATRYATCSLLDHMPSELDFELLLPADNASSGFDNIADLLFVSPVVMERYLAAAQKIARLAVGDMRMPVMVNIHRLSEQLPQDDRVDDLSFGTRGGLAVTSWFPLDADYTVDVETASPTPRPLRDRGQHRRQARGRREHRRGRRAAADRARPIT